MDQWIAKTVIRFSQIEPPGAEIRVLDIGMILSSGRPVNSLLFSGSAVEQLAVDRGAGDKGEALR